MLGYAVMNVEIFTERGWQIIPDATWRSLEGGAVEITIPSVPSWDRLTAFDGATFRLNGNHTTRQALGQSRSNSTLTMIGLISVQNV